MMIHDFYGLTRDPFSLSPDLDFLFLSQEHEEAVAHLVYGLEQNEDIILISGDIGTGKTMALHRVVSQLSNSFVPVSINVTTLDFAQLLQLIILKLDSTSVRESDLPVLISQFESMLVSNRNRGKKILLIIDEAQNLPLDVLESTRLLMNLAQPGEQVLQLVISGQLGLRDKIRSPELRQLRQRIRVDYEFGFLSRGEVREYVKHRLRTAGGDEQLFDDRALDDIFELSQGVPRVVNYVASKALLAGFVDGAKRISPRHFDGIDASELLGGRAEVDDDAVASSVVVEQRPAVEPCTADLAVQPQGGSHVVHVGPGRKSATPAEQLSESYAHRRGSRKIVWRWLVGAGLVGALVVAAVYSPLGSWLVSSIPARSSEPGAGVAPSSMAGHSSMGASRVKVGAGHVEAEDQQLVDNSGSAVSGTEHSDGSRDGQPMGAAVVAIPEPVTSQQRTVPNEQFLVHVASFLEPSRGDRFAAQMREHGVEASVHPVTLSGGKVWYRVYVGPFGTRQEASDTARRMKEDGWITFSRVTTP